MRRAVSHLQLALPWASPAPSLVMAQPPEPPPTTMATVTPLTAPCPVTTAPPPPPVSRTRRLVQEIEAAFDRPVRVLITDARSTLLSQADRNGLRVVRVHQMFLDAPDDVRAAVAHFLRFGDKASGRVIDRFVDGQEHLIGGTQRAISAAGRHHDLAALTHAVNAQYFGGRITVEVGWGAPPAQQRHRRRRRSITFGSYDHRSKRVVIHPALDQAHVPALVVARILHHELLHAWHGDERSPSGRRIIHSRAFRQDEKRFDGADVADRWLERELDALLAWRPTPPQKAC